MATIIISLVLLVMVGQSSFSGWFVRFVVLGTEAKEQAGYVALGCIDQVRLALVVEPEYDGDAEIYLPGGTCYVFPIDHAQLNLSIKARASVRGAYATMLFSSSTLQEVLE